MGTDFDLSGKQSADMVAFTAMIEEKLVPALVRKEQILITWLDIWAS